MMTFRLSVLVAAMAVVPWMAAAQDTPVTDQTLFLMPADSRLAATGQEGQLALQKTEYGAVAINGRALALPVNVSESTDERIRAHAKEFDYYFLPLTVGVAGLSSYQVQSFLVEFSLPERRVTDNDVWIVDVFPRLETAQGSLTADAELGVSGNLEMKAAAPGDVVAGGGKIDGKATVKWTYNPVFQSFVAIFTEADAMWSFDKVANTLKAGPIDVRLLIAVRKEGRVAKDKTLTVTSRIKAAFGSTLLWNRAATTECSIQVAL